MVQKTKILSLASYLPKRVLSNSDLEAMVDTSDEWIFTRTGIRERRIAAPEETTAVLGEKAAVAALKEANISVEDIDLIIGATMTPDFPTPGISCLIQDRLGAKNAVAFDIQAACSGFLFGLSVANAFLLSGTYRHILLVASEKMSSIVDYKDRSTCVLFGDGAAAAVLSLDSSKKKPLFTLEGLHLSSDGAQAHLLYVPAGGSKTPTTNATLSDKGHSLKMSGRELFKRAVKDMAEVSKQCLKPLSLELSDISWFIPHQANVRIMDAVAKELSFPKEKIFSTVHKYGNTSASSVAIALDECRRQESLVQGDKILLAAFGAGLTSGAAILTTEFV